MQGADTFANLSFPIYVMSYMFLFWFLFLFLKSMLFLYWSNLSFLILFRTQRPSSKFQYFLWPEACLLPGEIRSPHSTMSFRPPSACWGLVRGLSQWLCSVSVFRTQIPPLAHSRFIFWQLGAPTLHLVLAPHGFIQTEGLSSLCQICLMLYQYLKSLGQIWSKQSWEMFPAPWPIIIISLDAFTRLSP